MTKRCGQSCDSLCEKCLQQSFKPERNSSAPQSQSLSGHGSDQDLVSQDISRSEFNDASMFSTVFDGISTTGIDASWHLGAPFSSSFTAENSSDQYLHFLNGSNDSRGVISQDLGEAAAFVPTVPTSINAFHSYATSNSRLADWNDGISYPPYSPHLQPILEHGSYTPSNVQHTHYTQSASFSSTWDNLIGLPQTASHQADFSSNSTSSPYAEQYLLDIEQRGGDALSIHVRIPPSTPGAMYFGSHLMAEFSQEADGTLNVRVHLPPGYANINSTFVHA